MKIALFTSGHVRTLFYGFHENISLIKERVPDCEVDVFYSFWDDYSRSNKINDAWHSKKMNNIRKMHKEGKFYLDKTCRDCVNLIYPTNNLTEKRV